MFELDFLSLKIVTYVKMNFVKSIQKQICVKMIELVARITAFVEMVPNGLNSL